MPHTYKDLIVWQKAIELVVEVYLLTGNFPVEERYGLSAQMRNAAVSIPSNIAEGRLRASPKEYRHFLYNAYASGGELETQIVIAKRLPKTKELDFKRVDSHLSEVMRILNTMISNRSQS